MTDLLGICTTWRDGVCVVQPEEGPAVAIPLADIVSGKPVPPRPSVRARVTPRAAEGHVLALWPALDVEDLGEWVLRSDPAPVGRLLKRANSCLAIGDPGVPLDAAAARVATFYERRSREVLAQVEAGSDVEGQLLDLGWAPLGYGDNHFQIASLARAARACGPAPAEVRLSDDGVRVSATLPDGRATGGAAIDGDWLGLHGLSVEPAYRRRGLGRAIVAALLDWGAERGARTAWLHVETDNEPAIALYAGLGFDTHHDTRYLAPSRR